jgi:hypothetical protein
VPRFLSLRAAALALILGLVAPAAASAASGDPSANRPLSRSTLINCSYDASSSSCINSALADINAARAAEGVPAMVLPNNFASMTVPVQLLNLANLERVDRGLAPILGLSAALNQDAQNAAAQDADPMPTHFYGDMATSNWAGGDASSLEADFEWMYDDGMGSGNLDCTSSDQSGCWGHRHDILWHFSAPIAMGAGYGSGQYGPSLTELFVGGDTKTAPGEPDAPVVRPSPPGSATGVSVSTSTPVATVTSQPTRKLPPQVKLLKLAPAGSAVRLTVRCAGASGQTCKLAVTITGAGRHPGAKRITITRTVTIAVGHASSVRVPLSRALRRLLTGRRKLPVRVVVKQSGQSALVSRTLAL